MRHGLVAIGVLLASGACAPNTGVSRLAGENQALREENARLSRDLTERDEALARYEQQVATLTKLGPDRPLHKVAPVKLEIASLSGGADYDGRPGDDGVTLHLRPRDADGDAVKTPGKISIQLLDNSDLGSPRVVAKCVYDDIEQVREMWYGKFLTQHFTVKCPFEAGVRLPASRKLLATAEFVDIVTGVTLTANQEVSFKP